MKELINKPWEYVLYQKGIEYILSVVCGIVGLYEINIRLNIEEVGMYEKDGAQFIDMLVKKVCDDPFTYGERHIEDLLR